MPTPDAAGDPGQHRPLPQGSCIPHLAQQGAEGGCTGFKGVSPPQIHIHLELQRVTLFGIRTSVDVIS